MIEYKRDGVICDWHEPDPALTVNLIRKYGYIVRINGVIQATHTKEFEEAFNKEIMWRKLKNVKA